MTPQRHLAPTVLLSTVPKCSAFYRSATWFVTIWPRTNVGPKVTQLITTANNVHEHTWTFSTPRNLNEKHNLSWTRNEHETHGTRIAPGMSMRRGTDSELQNFYETIETGPVPWISIMRNHKCPWNTVQKKIWMRHMELVLPRVKVSIR